MKATHFVANLLRISSRLPASELRPADPTSGYQRTTSNSTASSTFISSTVFLGYSIVWDFYTTSIYRCGSKHYFFAMFSLEGVVQKRRRLLYFLALFCVCTEFAPTGCASTWLPVLVRENLSRACNLKWSRL